MKSTSGVGPVNPNDAQWAAISPFMLPAMVPSTKNTHWGPGIIVPTTAAANAPVTVVHGLGRKVIAVLCFSNNAGANLTPRLQWGTSLAGGVSTNQKLTVQGDEAMVNALLVMF
jgi:hypothetical protein